MLYDITPPIDENLAVWPGDTPPRREVLLDQRRGDPITLSTLHATVHLGAHVDAPGHYGANAPGIEGWELERFLGTCRVVQIAAGFGHRITPNHLHGPIDVPRILLRTGTFPDPSRFRDDFATPTPELIAHLADHGVKLIGVDTPSVDPADSNDLPTHRACLRHDVAILEGVVLAGVPEGLYELIALPLRLIGYDASPVRAVLRTLDR